jgi:GNAT superfamily N-acetyltransferase
MTPPRGNARRHASNRAGRPGRGVEPLIRPFHPEDKPGVIAIIKSVYDDYNYTIDFDHFEADLVDAQSTYQDAGGEFWVADDEGVIAGCVGVLPHGGDECELKRLYVGHAYRRRGLATRLLATAQGWAIAHGFRRMYLWSDVLLAAAHALYVKTGFRSGQQIRAIDPTNPTSVERFFEIDL